MILQETFASSRAEIKLDWNLNHPKPATERHSPQERCAEEDSAADTANERKQGAGNKMVSCNVSSNQHKHHYLNLKQMTHLSFWYSFSKGEQENWNGWYKDAHQMDYILMPAPRASLRCYYGHLLTPLKHLRLLDAWMHVKLKWMIHSLATI